MTAHFVARTPGTTHSGYCLRGGER